MDPVGVEPHYLPEAEGIFPFSIAGPFMLYRKHKSAQLKNVNQ